MKIKSIKIKNLFSYGNEGLSLELSDKTQIVGPNGVGKTNLARSLALVKDLFNFYETNTNIKDYVFGNETHNSSIELSCTLSEDEKRLVKDFFRFSIISSIYERMSILPGETQKTVRDIILSLLRANKFFDKIPEDVNIFVSQSDSEQYNKPNIYIQFGTVVYSWNHNVLAKEKRGQFTQKNNIPIAQLLVDEIRSKEPDLLKNILISEQEQNILTYFSYLDFAWLEKRMPEIDYDLSLDSFEIGRLSSILLNEHQEEIPNIENLSHELAQARGRSQQIDLLYVFRVLYDRSVWVLSDTRSHRYTLPASITTTSPNYINPRIELASFLYELKNSSEIKNRFKYKEIQNRFFELTNHYFDIYLKKTNKKISVGELEKDLITYLDSKGHMLNLPDQLQDSNTSDLLDSDTTEASICIINNSSKQIPLETSAAGFFEILAILALIIGKKDSILFLDEPAQNLHPVLQSILLKDILTSYSNNNQIVIITHSPYMVAYEQPETIFRFTTENGSTKEYHLTKNVKKNAAFLANIKKTFYGNKDWASMLFAERIVITEGADERAALSIWYEKYCEKKKNFHNNAILWIDGIGNNISSCIFLAKDWRIPYKAIVDNDTYSKSKTLSEDDNVLNHTYDDLTLLYSEEPFKTEYEAAKKEFNVDDRYIKDPSIATFIASRTDNPKIFDSLFDELLKFEGLSK